MKITAENEQKEPKKTKLNLVYKIKEKNIKKMEQYLKINENVK